MVDNINNVTDEQIKAFFEQQQEDTYVKISGNRVLRFHLGKLAPEYLCNRDEAVKQILATRGLG